LLAERLAASLSPDFDKPAHERLSSRELQVMLQIAAGKTVKEIAEEIHLSVKTVSTYRTRILQKMQLRNNADIMRYALLNGLGEATERPAFASS
jgi:DNA-binding NarL/FixJ family response regulator